MQRIMTISRFFKIFFLVYMVTIPLWSIFHWFVSTSDLVHGSFIEPYLASGAISMKIPGGSNTESIRLYDHHFSTFAKWVGFLGSLLRDAMFMVGIYFLIKLFELYEQGRLFTQAHVRHFKGIGIMLFICSTVGMMMADMIHTLAATFDKPVGQREIAIGFGTPNVELAIIGALIIVASWIMGEGTKLKEEQEFTI